MWHHLRRVLPALCPVLLAVAAACGGGAGGEAIAAAAASARHDPTAAEALLALDAFTLGSRLRDDGSVEPASALTRLPPGGTAYLSMEVGDAAPGSEVRVVWYGPDGHEVTGETRTVRAGQPSMTFSLATAGRPAGSYRGEVWFGDERVHDVRFAAGESPAAAPEERAVAAGSREAAPAGLDPSAAVVAQRPSTSVAAAGGPPSSAAPGGPTGGAPAAEEPLAAPGPTLRDEAPPAAPTLPTGPAPPEPDAPPPAEPDEPPPRG